MEKANQFLPALLCGSLALGLWAAPLRAQTDNALASVGAAALATPEELSEQEIIRRKEQLIRGQKALADAQAAMKAGKFDEAADAYTQAIRMLPKGSVAAKELAAAKAGVIEAYINKGKASMRAKNYEDARKSADEVLKYDPNNAAAKGIIKTAERASGVPDKGGKSPVSTADLDTVPRTIPQVDDTPEFRKAQNQTTQLLRDARLAFQSNQLDLAAEKINAAMALDRYNEEARVLLRQVNEQRYHAAQVDMARVRTQYAADTLEAWAPPVKAPRTTVRTRAPETSIIPPEKQKLENKLDTIRLPKIEFREANIVDVVNFLAEQSRAIDKQQGGNGVNIVFGGSLGGAGGGGGAAPAPEAAAPLPPPVPAVPPVPGAVGIPGAPGAAPTPDASAPVPAPAPLPAALPAVPTGMPGAAPISGTPAITLNLLDVPLRDALRYVTDIAGLKFIVDKYAILIVPISYQPPGAMMMREFQVPPGIFTTVMTGTAPGGGGAPGGAPAPAAPMPAAAPTAGGGTGVSSDDIKAFFVNAGVKFDQGASVTYQAATSRLFVKNTPDELDNIEIILNTLRRAGGTQVTIEAKFIEIQQTDLRELGFDWTLGDWGFGSISGAEPAFSVGGGTANSGYTPTYPVYPSDQTPVATATEKVTQGNRFASQSGVLSGNKLDALLSGGTATSTGVSDAVARMTGLLSNPQFQVILRALSQRKNVDLLCAPKVTTISGQQAKIEVVREFIYPTEFEPPRVASASSAAAVSGAAVSAPMISPPTPGGFQTRNLGVTLNVTPQIGETGLINLTLIPEVSDFDGFIDYGSRDSLGSSSINNNSAAAGYTLVFPFPQPVFSTRRVTTSVMVFDGSTVVLGGLMREDATKIQDKVPFLGDIPLVGKLFRSELENTIKKNLMVFVTARLIDPYGDQISPTKPVTASVVETAPPAPAAGAAPRP
ncbi:MAG: tetratricopeptide repeat protein [Verrucomicrobiia bacterium]